MVLYTSLMITLLNSTVKKATENRYSAKYFSLSLSHIHTHTHTHTHTCPRLQNVSACVLSRFSCVRLFATLGTAARQAPLPMGFSR